MRHRAGTRILFLPHWGSFAATLASFLLPRVGYCLDSVRSRFATSMLVQQMGKTYVLAQPHLVRQRQVEGREKPEPPLTAWRCAAARGGSRSVITGRSGGVVAGAQARVELHAVAPHCLDPASSGLPILHRMSGDRQLGARGEIAFADSVSHQYAGPFGLETPGRHRAVLVRYVHQQPGVRVRVLKLLDDAANPGLLLGFEHGCRMMRLDNER